MATKRLQDLVVDILASIDASVVACCNMHRYITELEEDIKTFERVLIPLKTEFHP